MQLAAVCSREIEGTAVEFGTTGYTMNHVFVLYDRDSDSVWYPLKGNTLDAVSGSRRGESIEWVAKPELMSLGKWRGQHPDTVVLAPPPRPQRRQIDPERMYGEVAEEHRAQLTGTWDLTLTQADREIRIVLEFREQDGNFVGRWANGAHRTSVIDLTFDGTTLEFGLPSRSRQRVRLSGTVTGTTIQGTFSPGGDVTFTCKGLRRETQSSET